MRLKPTQDGGRVAEGDTPWGTYRVEWSKQGNLLTHHINIKEPVDSGTECTHRGQQIRTQECDLCKGNVIVKVFECAIHGECSIRKNVGVTVCNTCPDRKV